MKLYLVRTKLDGAAKVRFSHLPPLFNQCNHPTIVAVVGIARGQIGGAAHAFSRRFNIAELIPQGAHRMPAFRIVGM
ncbi:MAG: hypothetical protein U1F34_05995 [Gammaproteobacteria bacterium]